MEEKNLELIEENPIAETEENEIMVKIENVTKQYTLGVIGGTTLKDSLARWWAKIRKKEDPTKKIGAKKVNQGEKFMALNGVSFEVKKGEAVGLIGHNGAGKSTLLKLITRVTAPTEGKIYLNGRVASMLEVGTGFHGELTGRENVYMNGAILGITKKEIDSKIDDIIEFSEVGEFIDTPVKRYSSGMFVKLAFSVAAHLDAEIMLMDEVLAVGDVNFQQKCIRKMREVADSGRTILYVSHNMSTIRQLCDRCVVLSKGQVIYDGGVEESIKCYLDENNTEISNVVDFENMHVDVGYNKQALLKRIKMNHEISASKQVIKAKLDIDSTISSTFLVRLKVFDGYGQIIGSAHLKPFSLKEGESCIYFDFDLENLCKGKYVVDLILTEFKNDTQIRHDFVKNAFAFTVSINEYAYGVEWLPSYSGNLVFSDIDIAKIEEK